MYSTQHSTQDVIVHNAWLTDPMEYVVYYCVQYSGYM